MILLKMFLHIFLWIYNLHQSYLLLLYINHLHLYILHIQPSSDNSNKPDSSRESRKRKVQSPNEDPSLVTESSEKQTKKPRLSDAASSESIPEAEPKSKCKRSNIRLKAKYNNAEKTRE